MKSQKSKMKLSEEVMEVKRLREEGMTYWEIANKIGRSYAWVYTRAASNGYMQVGGAQLFKEEYVIPWLQMQEHMIVGKSMNTSYYQITAYIDVMSRKEGVIYIWDVEPEFSMKALQQGIGELTIHQWGWRGKVEEAVFGIVFPESEGIKVKAPEELFRWVKEKRDIRIEFITDKEVESSENI